MNKKERNAILKMAIYGDLLLQAMDERNSQVIKKGGKPTDNFMVLNKALENMVDVAYQNKEIRSSNEFQQMQNQIETIIRKNNIV